MESFERPHRSGLSPILGLVLASLVTGMLFTSVTLVFTAGADVPVGIQLAQVALATAPVA